MRRMRLLLAVPFVVIALTATALAIAPGILRAPTPGRTSYVTQTGTPSWKVGDTWTYNITLGSIGEAAVLPRDMVAQTPLNESRVLGTLTQTVVGSVSTESGAAWNVTENVALLVEHPMPIAGPEPMLHSYSAPTVTVSGFVWYRQSDLARVYSFKSVHIERTWNLSVSPEMSTPGGAPGVALLPEPWPILRNGTYVLSYNATVQTWFHPPLAVLEFPLAENATYNVSSNATTHYGSSFRISGPNVTFGTDHVANVTVPIDLTIRTGRFENVTTSAGTFRALPISTYRTPFVPPTSDRDASAVANLTAEPDCVTTPHAFAIAWFSGQVGNVVRADLGLGGFGGPRIELTLVSYTYG